MVETVLVSNLGVPKSEIYLPVRNLCLFCSDCPDWANPRIIQGDL
jgi:hypothetical protein